MKLLRTLLYIGLGLGVLMAILGFFAKKNYHIERSIEIKAPKALIMEQVRNFKNFQTWSPWKELDPKMQESITGQDGEPGATYQWAGNEDVGAGIQTIRSVTADRVEQDLVITEPFKSNSKSFFQLDEKGEVTKVSWGFDLHLPFPTNVWSMFTNIDNAMGKDYYRGLVTLQKVCDNILHPKYRGYEVVNVDMPLQYYVGVRKLIDTADMSDFYMATFPKVSLALEKAKQPLAGHPSGLFWAWGENGQADMAAALPVEKEMKFGDTLSVFRIDSAQARVIDYYGAYQGSAEAHAAMGDYLKAKHLMAIPPSIEQYVTDPMVEKDTTKWLTKIIYFVAPDTLPAGK